MAETQTYGHTDIQRYLQHKMSPQEMHEFEKALMNDPFLADALEGFSAGKDDLSSQHLTAIERSLTNEKQTAKVVPLPLQKTAWWKVAAIIFVIISAGAITYSVINNQNTTSRNRNEIAVTTPQAVVPQKDSIGPVEKPMAQIPTDAIARNEAGAPARNTSPIIGSGATGAAASRERLAETESVEIAEEKNTAMAAPAPSVMMQDAEDQSAKRLKRDITAPTNEFRGKVVDKSGEPLPFANIKANNNLVAAVADARGNFNLKATDTILDITVNSPGYVSAPAQIRSSRSDNKIVLKEDELSLAEVVMTGVAKRTKNTVAIVQVDSSVAAEPVGGWRNFNQYFNQRLDSLKVNDAGRSFNEDIVLEFSINNNGRPTHIKAPSGTNKMLTDKAVEILSNGPKWKNKKKDKKVKVIIAF